MDAFFRTHVSGPRGCRNSGSGQLVWLNSFLLRCNDCGVSWLNGEFARFPHRALKESLTVYRIIHVTTSCTAFN
jgi:hypothetical protein